MKIYGIGTDVVNINRIKNSLKNKNFISRLFNKNEIKKCNAQINKANCYAKRFAAKEAFSKAIGTGISKGINFDEIIVYNIKGREVRSLFQGLKRPGKYSISWDALDNFGNPVSAGVYVYHVQADRFSQSRKMILLK